MPLYVCRRWEGTVTPQEGQQLAWVRPNRLRDYQMPPADEPLIAHLMTLLCELSEQDDEACDDAISIAAAARALLRRRERRDRDRICADRVGRRRVIVAVVYTLGSKVKALFTTRLGLFV